MKKNKNYNNNQIGSGHSTISRSKFNIPGLAVFIITTGVLGYFLILSFAAPTPIHWTTIRDNAGLIDPSTLVPTSPGATGIILNGPEDMDGGLGTEADPYIYHNHDISEGHSGNFTLYVQIDNVVIENNKILSGSWNKPTTGIYITEGTQNVTVRHNELYAPVPGPIGIGVLASGGASSDGYVHIKNNNIYHLADGIRVTNIPAMVEYNHVHDMIEAGRDQGYDPCCCTGTASGTCAAA